MAESSTGEQLPVAPNNSNEPEPWFENPDDEEGFYYGTGSDTSAHMEKVGEGQRHVLEGAATETDSVWFSRLTPEEQLKIKAHQQQFGKKIS